MGDKSAAVIFVKCMYENGKRRRQTGLRKQSIYHIHVCQSTTASASACIVNSQREFYIQVLPIDCINNGCSICDCYCSFEALSLDLGSCHFVFLEPEV